MCIVRNFSALALRRQAYNLKDCVKVKISSSSSSQNQSCCVLIGVGITNIEIPVLSSLQRSQMSEPNHFHHPFLQLVPKMQTDHRPSREQYRGVPPLRQHQRRFPKSSHTSHKYHCWSDAGGLQFW